MIAKDIESIVSLGKDSDELAVSETSRWWSATRLSVWIKADQDILLVAEEDKKIIGVLLTTVHVPTQIIYLSDIIIHKDYRRKGFATQLVGEALKQAKLLGIDWAYGLTQTNNENIQKLLKHEGFIRGEELVWFEKKPL